MGSEQLSRQALIEINTVFKEPGKVALSFRKIKSFINWINLLQKDPSNKMTLTANENLKNTPAVLTLFQQLK